MLTIAIKELIDALRDTRSLLSSAFYSVMGPGIVWLVARALPDNNSAVLAGMISVFALVSAFSGGMNVAMDIVAGERERKSLVPLLGNPVSRSQVVLGKGLAVMAFSLGGLILCLAAFTTVVAPGYASLAVMLVTGLIPLACMAAALEIAVSTLCRSVKEAQSYLSMLVFVPMLTGMFSVFFRGSTVWYSILPLTGHQVQLEHWLRHERVAVMPSLCLGLLTTIVAGVTLWGTSAALERDDAVYGI